MALLVVVGVLAVVLGAQFDLWRERRRIRKRRELMRTATRDMFEPWR